MFNYNKLRGRIVEKYGSNEAFAKAVGISIVSMSNKLNNRTGISREEILKWADVLDIAKDELGAYFFTLEV